MVREISTHSTAGGVRAVPGPPHGSPSRPAGDYVNIMPTTVQLGCLVYFLRRQGWVAQPYSRTLDVLSHGDRCVTSHEISDLHAGLVSPYQFADLGWSQPPQPLRKTRVTVNRPIRVSDGSSTSRALLQPRRSCHRRGWTGSHSTSRTPVRALRGVPLQCTGHGT